MARKNKDTPEDKSNNSLARLNLIHELIKTGSQSVEKIKEYLVEEYQPKSTIEYMLISQIIDIFIRLNRLQSHIKFTIEYRRQLLHKETLEKIAEDYSSDLQCLSDKKMVELGLKKVIAQPDDFDDDYEYEKHRQYQEWKNDHSNRPEFYDWEVHEKLVKEKTGNLEQELFDYRKINEAELRYFMQDKTIRDEENHLINCLTKYLNLLDTRRQEAQNNYLKLQLIKAQIKSKRHYDY